MAPSRPSPPANPNWSAAPTATSSTTSAPHKANATTPDWLAEANKDDGNDWESGRHQANA